MIRIEQHALGPRVFILGRRIHEWHLGVGILTVLLLLDVTDVLTGGLLAYALAFVGLWAILKDWRDITPSRRDTAAWTLGLHRPPMALRPARRGDWVPPLAAIVVAAAAVASLVSTLTPDVAWRGHVISDITPVHTAAVFHAVVIPTSAALLLASYYLWRRRRRAFVVAFALLVVLGFLNLLKGLDVEEALLSWAAAWLLWWGRGSFTAAPAQLRLRAALIASGLVLAATLVLSTIAAYSAAAGRPSFDTIVDTSSAMLLWQTPPIPFGDEFRYVPQAIGVLSLGALMVIVWSAFRPLPASSELPGDDERELARQIVSEHGDDALSFFKLRTDKQYLWNSARTAFIGYRVENRVLLVSGDPVGEPAEVRALMTQAVHWADRHDLRFAVIGASRELRDWCVSEGLRSLYIGDEAIVSTAQFSLEGRPIRKVRQSVNRLQKSGYTAELVEMHSATDALLDELEVVSHAWRGGAQERGFSMALDRLGGPEQDETMLIVARDGEGRVAGFIQFVPHNGNASMSLAMMRRLPDSPNGLMEFVIARSIELLRERGVCEISLNFAAFGRQLRAPSGVLERAFGGALRLADRWFQIERLYRFNAKFFPDWRPRYLIYRGYHELPRCALAVMWAEGQVPKPAIRSQPAPLSFAHGSP